MIYEWTKNWCESNNIAHFAENSLDSTNSVAKKDPKVQDFKLYFCDEQTQGRGRNQNTWITTKSGTQLLSSWVYVLNKSPQHLTSIIIGINTLNSLKTVWPNLDWTIKPPNDIYLNNKKVGGILIETISEGNQFKVIIGIGLNFFGSPKEVEEASHIENFDIVNKENYHRFLSSLKANFENSLTNIVKSELEDSTQKDILANINYSKPIVEVTKEGNLISDDGQSISWQEL